MSTPQNSRYGLYLRSLGGRRPEVPEEYFSTPVLSRTRSSSKKPASQESTTDPEPTIQGPISDPEPASQEPTSDPEPTLDLEPNVNLNQAMAHAGVSIPTFSGRPGEKADVWLRTYTAICKNVYAYTDDRVRATFPFHLRGQAQAWYQGLPDDVMENPEDIMGRFQARFDGSDAICSIQSIRQRPAESVHDYATGFQEAAVGGGMPERWLVFSFIEGLSFNLRKIVKQQDLHDLDSARRAALRAEYSEGDQEVNFVQRTNTDSKLDHLITLLQHQMLKPEQPQEPKQTEDRTPTYRKGRNFDNRSKENRHKCHYCKFKGHYEKDCPRMKQLISQIKRAEENDTA